MPVAGAVVGAPLVGVVVGMGVAAPAPGWAGAAGPPRGAPRARLARGGASGGRDGQSLPALPTGHRLPPGVALPLPLYRRRTRMVGAPLLCVL